MSDHSTGLHIGQSFESFLEDEGTQDEVDAIAQKRVAEYLTTICPDCGRDRGSLEPHRQGCESRPLGRSSDSTMPVYCCTPSECPHGCRDRPVFVASDTGWDQIQKLLAEDGASQS